MTIKLPNRDKNKNREEGHSKKTMGDGTKWVSYLDLGGHFT